MSVEQGSGKAISHDEPICGIVMPISALDDCTEAHWADVLNIVSDAIKVAGFRPNIVSNADESGIIQKRIIQNLYDNEIIICDVSGKNPNVMFELGIRLAFDKPTIVIKDDRTDYSFDTSPIEHVPYPRDLRFNKITEFKRKLSDKITATVSASKNDPAYTTFLKHFGEFKISNVERKEVGPQEFLLNEMQEIKSSLRRVEIDVRRSSMRKLNGAFSEGSICLSGRSDHEIRQIRNIAASHPGVSSTSVKSFADHSHLFIEADPAYPGGLRAIRAAIKDAIGAKPEFEIAK